jgi:hypothetical protein
MYLITKLEVKFYLIRITVIPVFKDHSRESQNMVSKHKWSLITGKICMESTIVVIEQEGLLTQVFFPTGFTKYLFYRQSTHYHCLGLLQRSNFKWPIVDSLTKSFGIEQHISYLSQQILKVNERLPDLTWCTMMNVNCQIKMKQIKIIVQTSYFNNDMWLYLYIDFLMGSQQSAVLCYVFPEDNGDYTS